jgi:DNA-binding transcriptional MerR regulator
VAWIPAQELAALVPCPPDEIRRLQDLGLLEPHEESGLFASADAHVVRLMAAFEEAGISLDDVARGVSAGEVSFPSGLFLPEPVELSETYEGLAARCGRSPELLRRLSGEVGLPPADGDRVRADDAEMLSLILAKLDLADDDELSRFARLYGGSIQRPSRPGCSSSTGRFASGPRPSTSRARRGTLSSTGRPRGSPSWSAVSCHGSSVAIASMRSSSTSSA